jgi:uncharacterized protein (TIGR04255 family)
MYSDKPRCRYGANQLAEVICQFYFPEIPSTAAEVPAVFMEAIREQYPRFQRRMEIPPPKVIGKPGQFQLENRPGSINCQFASADDVWRINLTSRFISLTCCRYTCWEEFAAHFDKPLAAFIQLYRPEYFQRIGLRYRNVISRKALGLEDKKLSELISPCYLGPLADPEVKEELASRCFVDLEMAGRGGCRLQIHAGPVRPKPGTADPETKFIFDQDFYIAGNVPPQLSAAAMNTLHHQAWSVFRGAITDTLHQAMKPNQ